MIKLLSDLTNLNAAKYKMLYVDSGDCVDDVVTKLTCDVVSKYSSLCAMYIRGRYVTDKGAAMIAEQVKSSNL